MQPTCLLYVWGLLCALAAPITASPLISTTAASPPFPTLIPRRFNPLPNPYEVPGTPITLDFNDRRGFALDAADVYMLLRRAHTYINPYLLEGGDQEFPLGLRMFPYGSVEMLLRSSEQYRRMRYSDVEDVLIGLSDKMTQEGYRERSAIVTYEDDASPEIETGEVYIRKKKRALISTS
ncbi:MAG: hypothetical protein LQ341_005237 [Variospora aurantia]|nr:MAG: hypothetical protein LQ341_005237 [Variospora aurantia]